MSSRARPIVHVVASLLVAVVTALCVTPSAAADTGALAVSATMNGQDLGTTTSGNPLWLTPNESVDVVVDLTNTGSETLSVWQVDFVGRVVGLSFFSYATPIEAIVPPGATQTLRYRLNLTGLQGQATGLIGAELRFSDRAGATVAAVAAVTDVRGSLVSVYGLFGVALLVLTALSVSDVAIALARQRLSTNRWKRGMRLLMPGIGIGLVIVFSASVLRLWIPDTGLWMAIAGMTAITFFAIGYFSPTPDDDDDFDDDFDEFDELAISDLGIENITASESRR